MDVLHCDRADKWTGYNGTEKLNGMVRLGKNISIDW